MENEPVIFGIIAIDNFINLFEVIGSPSSFYHLGVARDIALLTSFIRPCCMGFKTGDY